MVADRLGQQFGNYRLVSLLGQGGYAEVYLGQHVRFNQQAAIKIVHAHLSGEEVEHFQQEARPSLRWLILRLCACLILTCKITCLF